MARERLYTGSKLREFKECGPLRWEITDKYGDSLSVSEVRDSVINEVLNDDGISLDVIYSISLKKNDEHGWGLYNMIFDPRYQMLKLYPLSENNGVRVSLVCKRLQDCEALVDMLVKGNNMTIQPAFLTSV